MEKKYNLFFNHTLVLTENKEKNILERGLEENEEFLIKDYNWRETTIKLHTNIIVNKIREKIIKRFTLLFLLKFSKYRKKYNKIIYGYSSILVNLFVCTSSTNIWSKIFI